MQGLLKIVIDALLLPLLILVAVVAFRPFRWPKTFRFWGAFNEYKHGKDSELRNIERKLFDYISRPDENCNP